MAINPKAVKGFLTRPRDSYTWLKRSTAQELDQALGELKPKPDFGALKPWLHQQAAFLILNELKRFMFHIDMGGGKTLLTLMLLKYHKQRGDKPRAIVFVPYITSVETWVEEVAKHAPTLNCVPLLGTTTENLANLNGDGDLFVICYQSAVAMVSEPILGKKGKTKWQLKAGEVRKYFSGFDMLVCDEIHKCKNVSSLTFRMCRAISAQAEYSIGLTGTPFDRDLIDLWPQFYLIDFGDTLGPTLGFYKAVFFDSKPGYWGGYEHTFKKKLFPDLKRIIKNCSLSYSLDEFIDMPPKEYIVKNLSLPVGSEGYAQNALKNIQQAIIGTGTHRYKIVESNYLQLRQLSSGFMTLKGEDNDRLQIKFDENPKLDALMELVETMPVECKMVIFHHFVYSNSVISARLKEAKIGHARIWGKAKDPIGELRRFKADADCRVLIINSKSGSSSLNLQLANYVVFYEQPDSNIDRQQAEHRCWRPGQLKRVFFYDLLVKGTYDARIHKQNKLGENLLKSLLDGKEKP